MSYITGAPPGPNCGDMSSLTKALRPPTGMPEETLEWARKLRRRGKTVSNIAAELGYPEEEVRVALAPMRTANPSRSRATLNVTLATWQFVQSQQQPGEAIWETVGRLLTELVMLRAEVLVLKAKKSP